MSELPSGWITAKFGDLFDFKGGSQPPKEEFSSEPRDGYVRLLQIRDFEDDSKAVYIRDQKKWPKCAEHDIMIGRYGASVGKVLGGKAGAYNVALVRLIFNPSQVHHSWARYLCLSEHFQGPLANISRSAQNGFNKEDLKEIPIPFPPRKVQIEIAHKLDSLSARSKSAHEELGRVPKLVERYKQAVLSAAFRGNLTNDDPAHWRTISLGELITSIESGKNLRCEERPPRPEEQGIVKISSVTWGEFDPLASKTALAGTSLKANTLIHPGDFLISRANTLELVGACVIVRSLEACNLHLSDKVLRLRFTLPVAPWLMHFLRSEDGRGQIQELATGNQLSMRNISQSAIRSIRVPLPPDDVRDRIVIAMNRALHSSMQSLAETSRAHDLLDRFDQASLAKAFRAELIDIPMPLE